MSFDPNPARFFGSPPKQNAPDSATIHFPGIDSSGWTGTSMQTERPEFQEHNGSRIPVNHQALLGEISQFPLPLQPMATLPPSPYGNGLGNHNSFVPNMLGVRSNTSTQITTTNSPVGTQQVQLQQHYLQKRSRLPPKGVARKAPRKAGPRTPFTGASGDWLYRKTNVTPQADSKQSNQSRLYTPPEVGLQKDMMREPSARLFEPQSRSLKGSQGRPVTPHERNGEANMMADVPRPSIESCQPDRNTSHAPASTDRAIATSDQASQAGLYHICEYVVPKELQGVQTALGTDGWNEYLLALEKKCLGQITANEFMRRTKSIFATFDENTRRMMDKQVTEKMVRPMLAKRLGVDEEAAQARDALRQSP